MLIHFIASTILLAPMLPIQEPVELLPGIFVSDGIVDFTGEISIDCHHPDSPDVFLEMLVTAPDSREHESLFVSSIKPSALHAALLAAGFTAGAPIKWGSPSNIHTITQATGDKLRVLYSIIDESNDAESEFYPIESLVIDIKSRDTLIDDPHRPNFVFAGSSFVKTGYAADRSGTLISLTPFGDEVISPSWTLSPQADIDEPIWIANNELLPTIHTPVRIRIVVVEADSDESKADAETEPQTEESHQPDGIDIDRGS